MEMKFCPGYDMYLRTVLSLVEIAKYRRPGVNKKKQVH
mgnify:FL=1